jgi:hypothetical protein
MVLEMKALTSEAGSQKSESWDGPAVNGRVLWANLPLVFWSRLRRLMCGSVSDLPRGFRFSFGAAPPNIRGVAPFGWSDRFGGAQAATAHLAAQPQEPIKAPPSIIYPVGGAGEIDRFA